MSASESWPAAAEAEMLRAEIEALRRRRDAAHAELQGAVGRLAREAELASDASAEAERVEAAVASGAARAEALQRRIEALRQETERLRAEGDESRRALARETAAVRGLLARLIAVAESLGDAELRRWARREMAAPESP